MKSFSIRTCLSYNKIVLLKQKKIKVKMNKPVYLGLSKLEISETLMYEFWHDYIKQKYQQNAKLCYTLYYAISIRRKDYDRVCSA